MKHYIASALVLIAFFIPTSTHQEPAISAAATVAGPVLNEALVPICSCESNGRPDQKPRQYDHNGNVLLGTQNPDDVGMCQINVRIHAKELQKLGLDPRKPEDNITFANWLYKKEGSKPWAWSEWCWKK